MAFTERNTIAKKGCFRSSEPEMTCSVTFQKRRDKCHGAREGVTPTAWCGRKLSESEELEFYLWGRHSRQTGWTQVCVTGTTHLLISPVKLQVATP